MVRKGYRVRGTGYRGCSVLLLSFLIGCGDQSDDRFSRLFSGDAQIVDLTHSLSATIPYWPSPDGNPFRHDTLVAHADGSPIMAAYQTPEHHGTHLDAPIHGGPGQKSVDQLDASELFGPVVVIDVSAAAAANADYTLTRADVDEWEAQHGRLVDGVIVLLRTGWGDRWETPERYRNEDADGAMHFPGFGPDAARFLIEERSIRGIGIDNFSVDAAAADGFPVHGIVNGNGKFHLENVANLHLLPPVGAHLIVAPIKIEGGSGGQVRLFAILP
jgi:kynurenine formamidase